MKVELKTLDGCQIIAQVVKELMPLTKENKLKLTFKCQPKKIMIQADENLFREILINLIGNAIKFTKEGEIIINALESPKEGKIVVTITDTGIGIAKENQKFLFQRFQQAMARTLAREVGGTGLGLYISREFARLMRGEVVLIKSQPGKGSVFELNLPLAAKKTIKARPKRQEKKIKT